VTGNGSTLRSLASTVLLSESWTLDTFQAFDERLADNSIDTNVVPEGNHHESWLMMNCLVAKLDLGDESKCGGVLGHITVIASDDATQDDGVIITILRSVEFNQDIGVTLEDWKPEPCKTRVHRSTSVKKRTDNDTTLEGGVHIAEGNSDMRQLAINLDRMKRFAIVIRADEDRGKVTNDPSLRGTARSVRGKR
jgi:hypothetical protein